MSADLIYIIACKFFVAANEVVKAALRKYPMLPKAENYDPRPATWLDLELKIEIAVLHRSEEEVTLYGQKLVEQMRREIWQQIKDARLN